MSQPTLIVSLDFELFWGMQDGWELREYEANVLQARTTGQHLYRGSYNLCAPT